MKVYNLFGGPGSGKSSTAAGVFAAVKAIGHPRIELVRERAKELLYENKLHRTAQIDLVMEQTRRIAALVGHVDIVITDSPILLARFYVTTEQEKEQAETLSRAFDNRNYFINRPAEYQPYGRRQSKESAMVVDTKILDFFKETRYPYDFVNVGVAVQWIVGDIKAGL